MQRITAVYHHEDGSWWAESPDVAGFTASAETFAEVQDLVADGLPFYLGHAAEIDHVTDSGASIVRGSVAAWSAGLISAIGRVVSSDPGHRAQVSSLPTFPQTPTLQGQPA